MSRTENREELVRKLLVGLRGEEDLRKLCRALGYKDSKSPLPYRNWHSTKALELIDKKLVDTPMVLARAGVCDDIRHDFQIIYTCLLSNDLPLGHERIIVSQLLQQNYPHAVFVFSNADQTNWHFVNVKIEGGNKIRQVFRRISISQEDQKANRLRTAFERIMMLDLSDKSLITALDIQSRCDKAFDVESLNKQFFATFAKVFHNVAEEIGTQSLYKKQAKQRAQVLLNRMLFLYFIQKKGWLDNKQDYLYARFKACWKVDPKGHNYYVDVLAPLFAALSDPDADRSKVGVVPFLNGGLFEERQSNQIRIKNSTFKAIFDNLLEKYNFTVMEDTPLNLEVAVNPDMLGRIFESLILELEKDPDKDLRKLTGSYYTPRPIVHFMCQEALKEYLVTKLVDKNGGEAEMVRTKIDGLMAMPPAEELDDVQVETLTEYFTPSEAKLLQQAILDCRVCDPAVGSGAFPMGMLHEMVATISRLELRLNGPEMIKKHNYVYELKKQIIQNCLYGVDIQEQAVRLCELRLWLSLLVDYQIDRSKSFAQAIGKIDSLPNLSFRIVRGDSLLERLFGHVVRLDEMAKDARAKQLIESLQQDKNDHFVAGHLEEKRRLELKILAKQAELTEILIEHNRVSTPAYQANLFGEEGMSNRECKAKTELDRVAFQKEPLSDYDLETLRSKYFQNGVFPTFIWRANFAEVFLSKSGFDVIITNPPYLSTKHGFGVGNEVALASNFTTATGQYDAYALFLELSTRLAQSSGVYSFIVPKPILSNSNMLPIRQHLEKFGLSVLADVGRPFAASVESVVLIGFEHAKVCRIWKLQSDLAKPTNTKIPLSQLANPQGIWNPYSSTEIANLSFALSHLPRLGDLFNITRGIEAGKKDSSLVRTQIEGAFPLLRGEDVSSCLIKFQGIFVRRGDKKKFKPKSLYRQGNLLVRRVANQIIAALDTRVGYHVLNTVYVLQPKQAERMPLKYLCVYLNSQPVRDWFSNSYINDDKIFPYIRKEQLANVPVMIPEPDSQLDKIAQALAEAVLASPQSATKWKAFNDFVSQMFAKLGEQT